MTANNLNVGDPDRFYILHVEDQSITAKIDEDGVYEGLFKYPIEQALKHYGVAANQIDWELARSVREADAKISAAIKRRPGRPYDAVICDLAIPLVHEMEPGGPGLGEGVCDWRNGFEVLKWLAKGKYSGASQAILVMSNYAKEDDALKQAEAEAKTEQIRFDDWIHKGSSEDNSELKLPTLVAKFRRCLIPTEKFVRLCKSSLRPPCLFVSDKMKRLLRSLIFIASKDYSPFQPHAKILVLGEPGSGKGMLARTFYGLLRLLDQERMKIGMIQDSRAIALIQAEIDAVKNGNEIAESDRWRRPFRTRNCAQLVGDSGHGGRIDLFGTRGFQGMDDGRGVFEDCSYYENTVVALDRFNNPIDGMSLAEYDEPAVSERAGVVFLDEFADMSAVLQASVLNALEEGVVAREGGHHRPVRIGCHVVCATNFDPWNPREGDSRALRPDLIDRIPYILRMPPLRERVEEIRDIVESLASYRADVDVRLSDSALRLLLRFVSPNSSQDALIKSVRQLQMIADVISGESLITDSNLVPLFEKAKVYKKEGMLWAERSYKDRLDHARLLYEKLCKESDHLPPYNSSDESVNALDQHLVESVRELLLCKEATEHKVKSWWTSPQVPLGTSEVLPTQPPLINRWQYIFLFGAIGACKSGAGEVTWSNLGKLFDENKGRKESEQFKKNIALLLPELGIKVDWGNARSTGGLRHLIEYLDAPKVYNGQTKFTLIEDRPDGTQFLDVARALLVKLGVI